MLNLCYELGEKYLFAHDVCGTYKVMVDLSDIEETGNDNDIHETCI